jgi:hypothetical protein
MCRRQQLQQLHTEQLRGTIAGVPTLPRLVGKEVVDKTIIHVWRKRLQQGSRTRLWQGFHAQILLEKNQLCLPPAKTTIF